MADNLFGSADQGKRSVLSSFFGKSRGQRRAENNLGIIRLPTGSTKVPLYRNNALELFDAYYESRQYSHLTPWHQAKSCDGEYVPIRKRSPLINYAFSKVLAQRITSKLVGNQTFPTLKVEEDPDTQEYLRFVLKASDLKFRILEPVRRAMISGSVLVRFYIEDGAYVVEHFLSKYCYPVLKANGEMSSCMVKYAYCDKDQKDSNGNPKWFWFRMDLGEFQDIQYQPAEFDPNAEEAREPDWQVESVADHQMGFVQAEWFRTAEIRDSVDGYSLTCDILDYMDELNYSLSQSSQAVSYNQDPQLTIKGMTEDELGGLIRSSQKAWTLGKEGEASFLESGLTGVQVAIELRDKMRVGLMDISRVVLLDPEKLVASAQSGKAMEIMHGPMVELIQELRPPIGKGIKNLTLKMAVANLVVTTRGLPAPVAMPPGYQPKSLAIEESWPPIFPMTMEDLQKKIAVASAASAANLISRETGTRFIAEDFSIQDIEEEIQKIDVQKNLNPFGAF